MKACFSGGNLLCHDTYRSVLLLSSVLLLFHLFFPFLLIMESVHKTKHRLLMHPLLPIKLGGRVNKLLWRLHYSPKGLKAVGPKQLIRNLPAVSGWAGNSLHCSFTLTQSVRSKVNGLGRGLQSLSGYPNIWVEVNNKLKVSNMKRVGFSSNSSISLFSLFRWNWAKQGSWTGPYGWL